MGFRTEEELLNTARGSSSLQHFTNLYSHTTCLVEPLGLFGIPDLVIASHDLSWEEPQSIMGFAFEMKLSNWKRALAQAFRYRAFAEMSFVVLDEDYIGRALKQIERFQIANVGLLSTDIEGNLRIYHQPSHCLPFCEQTRANFEKIVIEAFAAKQVDESAERPCPLAFAMPTPIF